MFWLLLIIAVILTANEISHRNTTYYKVTKIPYLRVCFDAGRYGEYLTYKHLFRYEQDGARFLFNLYIPKGAEGTTEIDVLMISRQGLFVFESKNYSGWIFGNENQCNWYQTLPKGRGKSHKESFYNPVMQNRTHIKHLKALLGENIPAYSIVTFSDRCTLKKVLVTSPDVYVINRSHVDHVVASICNGSVMTVLDAQQIARIYDRLYPFSQVSSDIKAKHIADIQKPVKQETVPRSEGNRHEAEKNSLKFPNVDPTDTFTPARVPMTDWAKPTPTSATNVMEEITKAKQLFDAGVLTEQEFADLKAKLIAKL